MQELKKQIKLFIQKRDWSQFHDPKNLAMALSVEVSEILEIFQWHPTGAELDTKEKKALEEEMGDVLIYLLELADKYSIDIIKAAKHKLSLNEMKYPVDQVKGKSAKYTAYD